MVDCPSCGGAESHNCCINEECDKYISFSSHLNFCDICNISLKDGTDFKKDSKNESKPLMDELIPEFMLEMGRVLEYGRQKYGYRNWREAHKKELFHYRSAKLRHAFQEGKDKDTNIDHLVHEAINCMFLWWFKYGKQK